MKPTRTAKQHRAAVMELLQRVPETRKLMDKLFIKSLLAARDIAIQRNHPDRLMKKNSRAFIRALDRNDSVQVEIANLIRTIDETGSKKKA